MTAFKIGSSPIKPANGAAGAKKLEKAAPEKIAPEKAAPVRAGFDTANVDPNRLAVMPRMSALGGESAQRVKGGAVESLLRGSAAEMDDYFSRAYGFEKE